MRLLLITGEASGDRYGARVVEALRRLRPWVEVEGIGGDCLEDVGARLYARVEELAVVGIWEILPRLEAILRAYRETRDRLWQNPPDGVLLIDYPGLNLRVAGLARRAGIPVFYYIAPQVWAWRPGRLAKLARRVDRLWVVFPFEVSLYEAAGVPCTFVGHPLLDEQAGPDPEDPRKARLQLGLDPGTPWVGLFPGSRIGEIQAHLPLLVQTARRIQAQWPEARFCLALAPGLDPPRVEALLPRNQGEGPPIHRVVGDPLRVLRASEVVLVASGTVTLEAAILERPMVIFYRMAPLTYWLARRLVRVPWVGLPNIVAGREVVPELIQDQARPETLAEAALALLRSRERREQMQKDLGGVRARLGRPGAAERVARLLVAALEGRR